MKAGRNKKRSAAIAAMLAVAVLLTGTFAWQSISQQAKNEILTAGNVGGRLHDDFDGTNKDVYVENFTDPDNGGVPIFARVRLDEYMETGEDAGRNLTNDDGSDKPMADRKVTALLTGTDIHDVKTWKTHKPDTNVKLCALETHNYWEWTLGGETTFMPTFNKNKDSLGADINGTLDGKDGDGRENPANRYNDYIDYTDPANATKTERASYDADDNTADEGDGAPGGKGGTEGTNYTLKEETHTAKKTQNGTVITMDEWKTGGKKLGQFWVYDTDGWAYWAMPIAPGEATGLLLDQIEMTSGTDDDCYYAINVVGQFATAHKWGEKEDTSVTPTKPATGFFADANGEPMSADAEELLTKAADTKAVVTVEPTGTGVTEVTNGTPVTFGAKIEYDGEDVTSTDTIEWSIKGARSKHTTIDTSGTLTVGEAESAETLTIIASTKKYGVVGKKEMPVKRTTLGEIAGVKAGTTETVNVDGIDWYVLVNENGKKALLWSKDMIPSSKCEWGTGGKGAFGTSTTTNHWATEDQGVADLDASKNSTARIWCNTTFYDSLTELKGASVVLDTTLRTREQVDSTNFITTTDKVFFLSEADLFGTFNKKDATDGTYPVQADDYTYKGKVLVPDVNMRKCDATLTTYYWLRSPCDIVAGVAIGNTLRGSCAAYGHHNGNSGVRPALWVNLDL